MTLDEFVAEFASAFNETPVESFSPSTNYRELEEWGSLAALSVIFIVEENFDKKIGKEDLRSCNTIEDLYNHIKTK